MPISQINNNSLASGVPGYANLPAGSVLQVVQTTTTGSVSTTSQTATATNVLATITPKFSTSKIFIMVTGVGTNGSGSGIAYYLYKNGSLLFTPSTDDGSGRKYYSYGGTGIYFPMAIQYLDSPASTSSQTYTVYIGSYTAGQTCTFPSSGAVTNGTAVVTLMEIAG